MRYSLACAMFACSLSLCMAAAGPKGFKTAAPRTIDAIQPGDLAFEISDDGMRYIALRLRKEEAVATRVHMSGMHLSVGQKLYIYAADASRVYGPFTGAGPVESGEFWSEAIAGDLIVELQVGPEVVADLPFVIDAIEGAESNWGRTGSRGTGAGITCVDVSGSAGRTRRCRRYGRI